MFPERMSNVSEEETGHKNKLLFIYTVIEVIKGNVGLVRLYVGRPLKHNLIIEVRGVGV